MHADQIYFKLIKIPKRIHLVILFIYLNGKHPQMSIWCRVPATCVKRKEVKVSKNVPTFDMLKKSSIYFDKNNRTLPCFLKSYKTSKIVVYEFFKISISHILKEMKVRNAIFFSWGYATCYWLIKEHKNSEKRHVAYFFKAKIYFVKKNH